MTQHFFMGSGGARLAADIFGEGPDVLLMHGGGQTRGSWRRTAERLADRGYRAISYDARGHGESDWADGPYDMDLFAGDLRCVMDRVGGAPALIGASLGGLTALGLLGGESPPPASALVLVDIAPRINSKGTDRIGAFMTANPDGFASVEEAADAVALYMTERPRPRDVSGLRRNLRERDGRFYWHWDPSFIIRTPDAKPHETRERLFGDAARAIKAPTLMVRGELSELVDQASVEHLADVMPHAEVVEVPGAGHMVAGDANTPFADAVIAFLDRVYPAPARA